MTIGAATKAAAPRAGDPDAGARNLLVDCAGVRAGDSVLLIGEPLGLGIYDDALAPFLAARAKALGANVEIIRPPLASGPETTPADVLARIAAADHAIFITRLGDVLRFYPLPGPGSKTMCYALDLDYLGAAFGARDGALLAEARRRLIARIAGARTYTIRTALGADLTMALPPGGAYGAGDDFTVKTFPTMIEPPISARGLNGRMALSHALTSTSIHHYDDAVIPLESPIFLQVENGRIVDIEAPLVQKQRILAQFSRVADLFGGEALVVNSWHAGINPDTYYPRPALSEIDRWTAIAFGSPRYTHFHMCGHAPGDICGQMFDATISFDGIPFWDEGRFVFLGLEENRDLKDQSGLRDLHETRYNLGMHEGEAW